MSRARYRYCLFPLVLCESNFIESGFVDCIKLLAGLACHSLHTLTLFNFFPNSRMGQQGAKTNKDFILFRIYLFDRIGIIGLIPCTDLFLCSDKHDTLPNVI